jgi:hypothetical protein
VEFIQKYSSIYGAFPNKKVENEGVYIGESINGEI